MPHITGTPHGFVTLDKSEVHLMLPDSGGEEHEMIFSPQKFETFVKNSIVLLGQVKSLPAEGADVEFVHMTNVKDFQVLPMRGHKKIAITFLGDGSLPHHFALDAKDGPKFRDEIIAALKT